MRRGVDICVSILSTAVVSMCYCIPCPKTQMRSLEYIILHAEKHYTQVVLTMNYRATFITTTYNWVFVASLAVSFATYLFLILNWLEGWLKTWNHKLKKPIHETKHAKKSGIIHIIHIKWYNNTYMRVEQKVLERGFLCVSLSVCN